LKDLEEKDRIRNFQPPVDGAEIMQVFNLQPCREIGSLKSSIKDAILDGAIPNEHDAAFEYMLKKAEQMGLKPVNLPEKK
jgi:poly(A) polymerase